MNQNSVVITVPDRSKALAYLTECLDGSHLVEHLSPPVLQSSHSKITLVTSFTPPPNHDFHRACKMSSWPRKPWLFNEVAQFLRSLPEGVIIVEDFITPLSSPRLDLSAHPAFWSYNNTVYLPIHGSDPELIEQMIAWRAGFREIIAFATTPATLRSSSSNTLASIQNTVLSESEFQELVNSITMFVTDIFDYEGYMVWTREG